MSIVATPQAALQPATTKPHYLHEHTVSSWLLTTDHKRIGILYMVSITLFFLIGGAAATLMRLELATPQGDLVTSDHLQQALHIAWSRHGVVFSHSFHPHGARQLPAAVDDRRARCRLPAAESRELVSLHGRAGCLPFGRSSLAALIPAGPSTRPTAPPTRTATSSPWRRASSSQGSAPSLPA